MELIKDKISLCSTCFKQQKYIIPSFINDEKEKELIYKCYKHNFLNENNMYCIKLTEKLKIKLSECQIHKGEIFCGWCEECDKNLCQVCIGEELTKKKHNFILYNSLVSKDFEKDSINSQIIKLKDNFSKIKIYYEDVVEFEKDIKFLEKQINIIEFCYNLYFEKNIINYQILLNLKSNLEDSAKSFEKFKLLNENKYAVFLSFIKGKPIKDIKSKNIEVNTNSISNILILNPSLYDDEIKDETQKENYKNILILWKESSETIYVYDMNGNLIKSIEIEMGGKFLSMIQYQSNIILLYNKNKFYFIIFSPDFTDYEIESINLKDFLPLFMLDNRKYIPICSFGCNNKLFKIFENNIALLENNRIFLIKFNNNLIFYNKKYYNKEIRNNSDNNPFKFEIILNLSETRNRNYIDCIPIYYTSTEEKGIKHCSTITLNAKLDTKNIIEELKLDPLINTNPIETDIIYNNLAFTKNFDILKNNLEINILFNILIRNLFDYHKVVQLEESLYTAVENKIIISVEVEKNDRNFNFINKFEFNLSRTEILYLLRSNNNYINLVYMYSKNYLLFIINNNIYQIDDINNQVITIYNIDINFNKDFIYFNICTIHYYMKDLKKIEELILLKYENYVYPYYLNNHEITQIKEFNLPEFKEIIEINFLESSNSALADSLNTKRILVNKDKIIIFS